MKNIIFLLLVAALAGCNASTENKTPQMPGVYFMQSQVIDDGTDKTVLRDLKQLKIYTDDYYMYTQANPSDSSYSFGVGSYTVGDSGVIENVIFSASGPTFDSGRHSYQLNITTNFDGYKQVIPNIMIGGEQSTLTEEYIRSGAKADTPMEGVWKETKFYVVAGSDSVAHDRIQYKAYYNGYFMYGQFNREGQPNTAMGYGTYKMKNDHQMQETDLNSSYNIIPGQTYTIELEMMGQNQYKQTLTQADGSRHIELYERLK